MSKLFNYTIKTSKNHEVDVIITSQQIQNDINGNPRFALQVWILRENGGNLWTPKIKGYKSNKNDQYIVTSYAIEGTVSTFIDAFEETVYQD